MTSNIPETDITRNWEQSALNRMFPCPEKVYSVEEITKRLDSIETLLRITLDRLADIDGKRIKEQLAPFGYDITVVEKEY